MAFQKIWRALFSCNHRFEIPRLAVLATNTDAKVSITRQNIK